MRKRDQVGGGIEQSTNEPWLNQKVPWFDYAGYDGDRTAILPDSRVSTE